MLERSSPIYQFIIDDVNLFGSNKKAFLANIALWITPIIGLHFLFPLVFFLMSHGISILLTRREPKFFEILVKTRFQRSHYFPWPKENLVVNKRPIGFGRNTLC